MKRCSATSRNTVMREKMPKQQGSKVHQDEGKDA